MKKLLQIVTLLLCINTYAQITYSQRAHTSIGFGIDPLATFDHKDITGKIAPDMIFDFVYTNRYINIRASSEIFPSLNNYKDLMFAFGLNFEAGSRGQWQFVAAPRGGWVWREDNDGVRGRRNNIGIELSTVYWITDGIAFFLLGDSTKRYDQEILGWDATTVNSLKAGIRIKIKNMK